MEKPFNLQIVNFVALAQLDCELDLAKCAERLPGKYGQAVLQATVVRSANPKVTTMIMSNGKLLMCGASEPDQVVWMAWLILAKLYQRGLITKPGVMVSNVNIENIVAKYYVGFEINLQLFFADHKDRSVYHPQKIAPVRFYSKGAGLVHVVYRTGWVIITGSKAQQQTYQATKTVDWAKYRQGKEYREFIAPRVLAPSASKKRKTRVKPKRMQCEFTLCGVRCGERAYEDGVCSLHEFNTVASASMRAKLLFGQSL